MATSWDKYWNSEKIDHRINQVWADYFVRSYERSVGFARSDVVLDYGAGTGDVAYRIKDKVRQVYVYDRSELMTTRLRRRFDRVRNVQILTDPWRIERPVSVIIVNSVVQYMDPAELAQTLARFREVSSRRTILIISDVVPASYHKLHDALSQLRKSVEDGFFVPFVSSVLSRLVHSPALSVRTPSLQGYDERLLTDVLSKHGYRSRRTRDNFSPSIHRYTLQCTLSDSPVP